MSKIAFLGMGQMGSNMAAQLLKAGHELQIYNRSKIKAEPLIKKGATYFDQPKDAINNVEYIFSMLSDDNACKNVWLGEQGALNGKPRSNATIIECSTYSHEQVMTLSQLILDKGWQYIDSPVTGLPTAAAKGALTLFLGANDQQIIKDAQFLLDCISCDQIYFGEIGKGTAYKLIVNLMGSIQIAALAEGMLVAQSANLDLDLVANALGKGACGSAQVIRNSLLMAQELHDQDVLFNANLRTKDTNYGVQFAKKMGQNPKIAQTTLAAYNRLIEQGFGLSAESKIIKAV